MTSADGPIQARVAAVLDIAPGMRRLVLAGDGLSIDPPPGALGPYLKLHLPDAAGRERIRTYSLRQLDRERGEIHVDIALHGEDSVGSRFALSARRGDQVGVRGPGVIPAPASSFYLCAGDQTTIPAIANMMETLPGHAEVHAVIEVDHSGMMALLPEPRPHQRVTWLHRAAGTPSRAVEAACAVVAERGQCPFLWAGGEACITRALRKHARTTFGLEPAQCQILNYWKAGRTEGDFDCLS